MKFNSIKIAVLLFVVTFHVNAQNTLDNLGLTSSTPSSVAYSLRLLSSSYTGPLVRIKVGSSFYDVYPDSSTKNFSLTSKISAVQSVYNSAVAVASANTLNSIVTSGTTDARVAIWYDQSGNSKDVLTSSATGPKIITLGSINIMNGKPTIYFASVVSSTAPLVSATTVDFSTQQTATVNAVAQNVGSVSNISGVYATGLSGGWGLSYDPTTSAPGYWLDGSGCNQAFTGATSFTPKIVTGFLNKTTSSSTIYENSILKGTKTLTCGITNGTSDNVCVGIRAANGGTRKFDGYISEVILFPSILSTANQTTLETNQNTAYFSPSVTISSNVTNNTICLGTSVTFTATPYNITSPNYQWYKNSVAISGETNATYTSTSLSNSDQITAKVSENSANIASSGLVLNLDAGNTSSYPGTGTTWTDLTGRGNNGIVSSPITYNSLNGGYFQFASSNGIALPATSDDFNFTNGDFTVELWVNSASAYEHLISLNTNSVGWSEIRLTAGATSGKLNILQASANGGPWIINTTSSSSGFTWNNWHQVVLSRVSNNITIYVDGVSQFSTTVNVSLMSNIVSSTYNTLGSMVSNSTYGSFSGKMSIVRSYKGVGLSTSQIVQNFNSVRSRYGLSAINYSSNTFTASVVSNNTVNAGSSTPTLCVNTALTNITHTTTGATGIGTATGLPTGVTAVWATNTITISGTPTASGTFNYSIPLTGGCGSVNATGTITVNQFSSVSSAQVLVVAGGGSGGVGRGTLGGAGGGAGGVVFSTAYTLTSGTYNVTVGNGGSSITAIGPVNGNNGADSVFGTLTAKGGGGGGSDGQQGSAYFGLNGGSGGGSAVWASSAGASTQTTQANETNHYGNSGGIATNSGTGYPGGGGGGAGHAGYTPNLNGYGNLGGNGGEGITVSFSSGSPTGYFAAGGGGSGGFDGAGPKNRGIGGSSIGGDGDGLNSNSVTSGATNTGSGGGGSSGRASGAGGSGVVIIQYLGTPIATGGTITQSNGYTIHTFTSSGIFSNGLAIASSSQTLCQNATATALTSSLSGVQYTFQWYSNNSPSNTGGTIINGATLSSYTPSTANAGTMYYYVIVTNSSGCSATSGVSGAITITASNTISLSSALATNSQQLCSNTVLTNITHTTVGVTGIGTATGLPAGVTAAWATNTLTISGTPTASGTFNYSIPLTGGCGSVNATGTITVNPSPIVNVTVNGDACINKTTLSATTGLTSYAWYKDNVLLSGAINNAYLPSASGDYKVLVTNGTCTNTSSSSTIYFCGVTADGKMVPVDNSTTLISKEGAINNGKGIDERGLIVSKPFVYGTVTSSTGRIWMDRNLGASRVAISSTDTQAYGDYYQWGRPVDGHQTKYLTNNNSTGFTNSRSATSVPSTDLWIQPTDNSNDWLSTPDNSLWTGANPANNPCPAGFRIPTETEWNAERATWTTANAAGAFASPLKLTLPGMLTSFGSSGAGFTAKNNYGQYQTQTAYTNGGVRYFGIEANNAWFDQNYYKSHGMSCRCIKD